MNDKLTPQMKSALKLVSRQSCPVAIKVGSMSVQTAEALLRRGLIEKYGEPPFSYYWRLTRAGHLVLKSL